MQQLKPIYSQLKLSATLRMNMYLKQMKEENKKVYALGFGQSPFPIPQICVKQLQKHANEQDYIHIQGLPATRKAVIDLHNQLYGTKYTSENVILGPGSKELMFIAQSVLTNNLIVPAPAWVSHLNHSIILQKPYKLLDVKEKDRYLVQINDLKQIQKEQQYQQPQFQSLVLNYPNNPHSQTYSDIQLQELAEYIKTLQNNFLVFSDEIYGFLDFEGTHTSISKYLPQQSLVVTGVSKWLGAGGWRFGYMIIPEQLNNVKEAMCKLAGESFSSLATPIQHAVIPAFTEFFQDEIQNYLKFQRKILKTLSLKCAKILREVGVKLFDSQGGYYLYLNFENFREKLLKKGVINSQDLSILIIKESGVLMLPGYEFGQKENFLTTRLCFVDFDGKKALEAAKKEEIDENFIDKYCARTLEGTKVLVDWINNL